MYPIRFPLSHPRYRAVPTLQERGITPCLWAEDVLLFYGVHEFCQDLCLLIPDQDLETAANLVSSIPGWRQSPLDEDFLAENPHWRYLSNYWSFRFCEPNDKWNDVQLFPAKEFAEMDISEETTVRNQGLVYPKLESYIESLIFQYLRPATSPMEPSLLRFVANHLEFLSEDIPDPEEVSTHLSPKAQKLWMDILKGDEMLLCGRRAY
jgi:hypothetical protein